MNDENTRDAAEPSPASAGSRPVAWAAGSLANRMIEVHATKKQAEDARLEAAMGIACQEWEVFAIYRSPLESLTAEERDTIRRVSEFLLGLAGVDVKDGTKSLLADHAATLLRLLGRLG
jgi:hypothetical protein